jgi:hypothetical protein
VGVLRVRLGRTGVLYQEFLVSGFERMPGDTEDARHINLVLEHWFRVFSGEAAWRSPNFFFPQVPGVQLRLHE